MTLYYKNLSATQQKYVKKYIANGCGAKGGVFNPPDYVFNRSACIIHDFDFWRGGNKKDFTQANKFFYKNMLANCKAAYKDGNINYFSYLWVKGAAYRYWKAVQWFGKDSFHFTDTPRNKADLFFLIQSGKPQKKDRFKAGQVDPRIRG